MENELEQWWMDVTSNIPKEVSVSSTWEDHAKYYVGKVAERETQAFNAAIEAALGVLGPLKLTMNETDMRVAIMGGKAAEAHNRVLDQAKSAIEGLKR